MLIKKKLLQIPPQPCPDVKLKKKQAWEKEDLKAAVQVIDGIVVVDAYGRKKNLVKRFFADGKNWQYYDAENETWSQTQDGGWFDRQKYVLAGPVPDEAAQILEADNWRHEQNDLGGMICDYTRKIAQDRRYRYEKNKNDRIREMVQQTKLPLEEEKKIAKWLKEDVFQPVSLLKPKNDQVPHVRMPQACDGDPAQGRMGLSEMREKDTGPGAEMDTAGKKAGKGIHRVRISCTGWICDICRHRGQAHR